jgi:DnaA family protein
MEQLVFDLAPAEPPTFASFLPGRNLEAVASLARFAAGEATTTGVLLWGAPGAGKSHLLRACVAAAEARGAAAAYFAGPGALMAVDPEAMGARAIVAVDAIDAADADAQGRLFTLFNALQAAGGHFVGASRMPLAALALREDLRTRLGWGLVHEVLALADDEKPAALAAYAKRRGFAVPDDVIRYLLSHGRRDMPTLLGALAALDRRSLALQRPVTLPMLREWLQREVRLD